MCSGLLHNSCATLIYTDYYRMKATLLRTLLCSLLASSSTLAVDGLLGYWRLDEGGGDIATDSSGNGNDGEIIEGSDAWVDDPERGSVYQSGNGSFIDLGEFMPVIDLEQDFTWSFWVLPNQTDNNNIVLGNRWSPDGSDFAPREFIKFTPRVFEWHFDGGGENIAGDDTMFVVDEWSHNLVVKSGTALTYYRNGEKVASSEISGAPTNAQPLYLGGQDGRENFEGLFDEVAVFDRALSEGEALEVFELGLGESSLVEGGDDPNISNPSRVTLGQVASVPAEHTGQFKVRNTGSANMLTLSSIDVSGSDGDHFSVTTATPITIAPGAEVLIDYQFDSLGQSGGFFGQFDLNSDDASDPVRSVEASATIINLEGPIAHYRFDEAAGAENVRDSTGFERGGNYLAGGGSVTTGAEGLAGGQSMAVADGGQARIPASNFDSLNDFTISLWISQNATTADLQTIFGRGFGAPSFAVLVSNGDLWWLQGSDANPLLASTGGLIQANQAHHVVALADSTAGSERIAFYVDGVEVASLSQPDRIPDEPETAVYFGAFDHNLGFSGRLDDTQIYDRALSDDDILSIFNNPGATLSDTKDVDSDGDGLSDVLEAELGTDPLDTDSDADGLGDGAEVNTHNTSPTSADSDGDGANDRFEINNGTDPTDAASKPEVTAVNGLLGYWRFDEGEGHVATDLSGNGHDGEIIEPDGVWVNDPARGSVYQSGGGSWVEFGNILPVLDLEQDFTWSFWVNPGQTSNNNIVFGNRYMPDGTDFAPREFIKFTPTTFEWHVDGGGQNVPGANTAFEVDVWSHNLVVKNGDTLTYYRDGEEVESSTISSGPANPQPLYLGGQNGIENFSGLFDDVAIFDRALSSAEVATVYQTGDGGGSLIDNPDPNPGNDPLPSLTDVGIQESGAFGVTLPEGVTGDVEYSTDLDIWEVIATGVTGAFEETDATRMAAPEGYYRAKQ